MAKPNRTTEVHKCLFNLYAQKTKRAICLVLEKESLNNTDVQAIKELIMVLGFLISPSQENGVLFREVCSSDCREEFQ